PALEKPLAKAVTSLRTKPGTPPADLLWPVAQYWWSTSGEADLKAQVGPVSLLHPPDPALVAARVNDTDIPRAEIQENARTQEEFIRRSLMDRPAEMEVQLALLRERTLDELIQKVLILDAFEKNGGTLKEEFLEQDLSTFVTQHFGGDLAAFHKSLAADGLTVERFKKMRRETMIVQYVRAQVTASVKEPADAELRVFYSQQVVKKAAREVHLHAITLPKADFNGTAQNPRQLAAEIRAKALQGADFEQLAKTYSQDDNAKNGGCRGTIDPAELYKPLQDALLTMKARDVSQVIEIETAFVLLWIKDEKPKSVPPFETERPRLLKEVLRQNQDALFKRWIDEKRQSALIEIIPAP
ncbi:MAG: SurA N-terminal domain-containing protein, partial [Prosthecobacter sp.]|nr:SurA N-terminal domain-containing protein [Prosthecobacter sp.]